MGRIGEIVEVKDVTVDGDKATEITVALGANDNVTAVTAFPAGQFAKPQKGDLAVMVELDGAGEWSCVGFIDVSFANAAGDGEIYLYSRAAGGTRLAYVHLKSTGAVDVYATDANGAQKGVIQMAADGQIQVFNAFGALTISPTGDIKLQNSANEVDLVTAGCLVNGSVIIAPGQNP